MPFARLSQSRRDDQWDGQAPRKTRDMAAIELYLQHLSEIEAQRQRANAEHAGKPELTPQEIDWMRRRSQGA